MFGGRQNKMFARPLPNWSQRINFFKEKESVYPPPPPPPPHLIVNEWQIKGN